MNKLLKPLAEKYSLKEHGKDAVYGIINNYQVVISISAMSASDCYIKIYSNFYDVQKSVATFIDSKRKNYKLRVCNFTKFSLTLDHMSFGLSGWVKKTEEIILEITNYLKSIGAKDSTYCPGCLNPIDVPSEVIANGDPITLCSNCASQIKEAKEKAEIEYQAAPGNYGKGILGAVVGALIGGVAWIALAAVLGLISAFIAILISYLASTGYDKMKGKQNKYKTYIITITSLVVIVLSMYLSYVLFVYFEGVSGSPFDILAYRLKIYPDLRASFISDMIFSLAFGFAGVFIYLKQIKKKIHK